MKQENFSYRFKTPKTPAAVFEILLDVRRWWSGLYEETIDGESTRPGDEFTFKAGGGMHVTRHRLVELVPGKKMVWLVTESALSFLSDPAEWKGTKMQFDLSPDENGTEVVFTHDGLTPQIECYTNCSAAWTGYLNRLEQAVC